MREQHDKQPRHTSAGQRGVWMAIGIAIGIAIGVVVLNNVGIGIAIGLIFGIAIDAIRRQERQKMERNGEQAGSDS
ncbi:MAG: hypothetical protein DYG89_24820 [Caldilinea sp. CFX5]|nr:hypothetical protein [Caldilinea sp. CFX5]